MQTLTKTNFQDAIQKGISLVNIGAPWCPDCRKIEPIIQKLAEEYEGKLQFYHIQADEEEALKEELKVRRIPTLIFYKDGQEVGERLVEPNSKPLIENAIQAIL